MAQELTSLDGFKLVVPPDKVRHYLLNLAHPRGGPKAKFFLRHGFSVDDPETLSAALVQQAWASDHIKMRRHAGGYGTEISAVGPIVTPSGINPMILTAWNWDQATLLGLSDDGNARFANFVTARPA